MIVVQVNKLIHKHLQSLKAQHQKNKPPFKTNYESFDVYNCNIRIKSNL